MKEELRRKETGITLVALVVTIVVLLILAGITIMYTMGDNSIFKKAQDAKNKTADAVKNEQEYMNSIDNMVNEYINGTGNGGGSTATVGSSTTEDHTAGTLDYSWEKIDKIATAIAKSTSVTESTTEVSGTVDGEAFKIGVGDIATVQYSGTNVRVRVLGFKHDDLVNKAAYGGNHTKASISFEFLDFMTGSTYKSMNESDTNENGWAATQMRKDLNGYATSDAAQSGAIGGLGANLSNKSYIKQVTKKYIPTYNTASTSTCNDYLWLLAASEVVNAGDQAGGYGYAITSEGSQYMYYQKNATEAWNTASTNRQKGPSASSSTSAWWLRSPGYDDSDIFCSVHNHGYIYNYLSASRNYGVAPGFCI